MNRYFKGIAAATVVISLAGVTSCRRKADAVKSDLGDAGFSLTAEDWFRASRENNVSALKTFIAGNFSTDTRDGVGDSALHVAAASGAKNSAEFLLNHGLAVDLIGAQKRTPLMASVIANQTEMTGWLLRQGADPQLKDQDDFKPLMLAVREGSAGSVAELAAYNRDDLDAALLLAALVGKAEVIDALTNYGASVYARMEDGRTPLMIATENGHEEAVKLLIDIGSSRYAADPAGRTAVDFATAAGHLEIASWISREPQPEELALESPEEIAESLDVSVETAIEKSIATLPSSPALVTNHEPRSRSVSLEGQTLSAPVVAEHSARPRGDTFPMPALVMRQYREREIPISIKTVDGDIATIKIAGATPRELKVRAGDSIPGSNLTIVRVQRRMEDSKVNPGGSSEISVVQLRDSTSGTTREWIAGISASAHDPVALVEDSATGKRYVASPGQRFTASDGSEFLVTDVRPNQLVIQDLKTSGVTTIPLRGPRG